MAGSRGGAPEAYTGLPGACGASPEDPLPASPWPPWSRCGEPESSRGLLDPDLTRLQATPPVRCDTLERRPDSILKAPSPSKDLSDAQRVFERCQAELISQSRRQDEVFDSIAKVEADLSRVARLAAENEGLHATERHQRHGALASVTRRTEDALLTCESLRRGQELLIQKVERLEALAEDGEHAVEETGRLQQEVVALQDAVREKLDVFSQALRRLDALEQVTEENAKLRQEVAQLRRASERRDLEMAAVQGQLDALTKLVREQCHEPLLLPRRSDLSPPD